MKMKWFRKDKKHPNLKDMAEQYNRALFERELLRMDFLYEARRLEKRREAGREYTR